MCDTRFSIYMYSVRLESVHVQVVIYPLGFSVVGVFKTEFMRGPGRCDTSNPSDFNKTSPWCWGKYPQN